MLIQPYRMKELQFAWCNRIYFRTRTHRRKSNVCLAVLNTKELADILKPYDIQVLEFASSKQEIRGLLSLKPFESTSNAIGKTKGRISKWLSDQLEDSSIQKQLAAGYFAVTVGQSNAAAVDQYLENQPAHHGYADRARPPVLVRSLSHSELVTRKLHTDHSITRLRYHIVLVVPNRRGVFHTESASAVINQWLELPGLFLVDKVSFLPDHVHIALSLHPKLPPAVVACELMNCAQEFMWKQYSRAIVNAGIDRLWQASAYIGSFGDLSSNALSKYIRHWTGSAEI